MSRKISFYETHLGCLVKSYEEEVVEPGSPPTIREHIVLSTSEGTKLRTLPKESQKNWPGK